MERSIFFLFNIKIIYFICHLCFIKIKFTWNVVSICCLPVADSLSSQKHLSAKRKSILCLSKNFIKFMQMQYQITISNKLPHQEFSFLLGTCASWTAILQLSFSPRACTRFFEPWWTVGCFLFSLGKWYALMIHCRTSFRCWGILWNRDWMNIFFLSCLQFVLFIPWVCVRIIYFIASASALLLKSFSVV